MKSITFATKGNNSSMLGSSYLHLLVEEVRLSEVNVWKQNRNVMFHRTSF